MKKVLVVLFFIISCSSSNAKWYFDEWGYFSSDTAIELRILPFVSLELSPDMGFSTTSRLVSDTIIEGRQIAIFEEINLPLKEGDATNFQFRLNEGDPILSLMIMECPEVVKNFLAENPKGNITDFMKTQIDNNDIIKESLQSALGMSVSTIAERYKSPIETHEFFYKGHWYVFTFETKVNVDQRKTYESIIKSITDLNKNS